jgi:hypothetical protein
MKTFTATTLFMALTIHARIVTQHRAPSRFFRREVPQEHSHVKSFFRLLKFFKRACHLNLIMYLGPDY